MLDDTPSVNDHATRKFQHFLARIGDGRDPWARGNPKVKAVIERAARLRRTTLSAYLLESAFQKAQEDIRQTETVLLAEEDRNLFFSLLNAPPVPNAALKE
jgi:uncharacterized protein (DUF1778 family)